MNGVSCKYSLLRYHGANVCPIARHGRPQNFPCARPVHSSTRVSCASPSTVAQTKQTAAQNNITPLSASSGALERRDYANFVTFFRQASPYIEGHRGRTFVLVVPGEVVDNKQMLNSLLEDIALLHGLGVRLVLVVGARPQINRTLLETGHMPQYTDGLRVTDKDALQAAIEAAGCARMEIEARLSKGPAVSMVRRHARSDRSFHYGPAVQVISGNYVAAKRRGVVGGVDYQHTGVVRFVQVDAVKRQLDSGSIVLLSNLGYSAAGEVLNCDVYTVGCRAAINLEADKLLCMTLPSTCPLALPKWLPLSDAERMLVRLTNAPQMSSLDSMLDVLPDVGGNIAGLNGNGSSGNGNGEVLGNGNGEVLGNGNGVSAAGKNGKISGGGATETHAGSGTATNGGNASSESTSSSRQAQNRATEQDTPTLTRAHSTRKRRSLEGTEDLYDFAKWASYGLPSPLMAAVVACRNDVKRAHLVDTRQDGSLLLELYSRDGVGCMISTDFYEGIRPARQQDSEAVAALLKPLEDKGVLVHRSKEQLAAELPYFTVFEQSGNVLACALVKPLGTGVDGLEVCELGAFCVHPSFRGAGRGDSMLDYLEQDARARGIQRMVLLTTRTAEWFQQRGFQPGGPAHRSEFLPEKRRAKVDAARNSQLYVKDLFSDSSSDE